IYYGKDGDLTGPDREHAEVSMLALHLLQSSLVHINTLLLQQVLEDPMFREMMGATNDARCSGPTSILMAGSAGHGPASGHDHQASCLSSASPGPHGGPLSRFRASCARTPSLGPGSIGNERRR
ncbi:hypothetical protein, partial [Nocardia gipuzkoensis]